MTRPGPYAEYVDLQTQTFASLPAHWAAVRGRNLVSISTGSGDTVDAEPEGDYPFYVRSDRPLRSERWEFDGPAVLTAGDGAGVAKVFHLVGGKFMAHQRVYVLREFRGVSPQFFFYAFSSLFRLMALDGSAKSTVDSVRRSMIADMPFALPPPYEQLVISDYLDRETAQIDALIGKQERLIETLRERRAAVVSLSIDRTEGLTPVRRHVARLRQGWSPNCEVGRADGVEEWGVLKTGAPNGGVFSPSENKRLPDSETPRPETVVQRGEIVMSRASSREWVGSAALVDGDYPRLMLSDLTYSLRLSSEADPRYVVWALGSRRTRGLIEAAAKGTSPSMQKLSQRDIRELTIWLPPLTEQRRIADYLDEQTAKIDALIAKAKRFIELSKERRSALITAAVTGQIDVRDRVELRDPLDGKVGAESAESVLA